MRDLEFLGFHVFAGSQNLHADILCEALATNVACCSKLAERMSVPVRYSTSAAGSVSRISTRISPLIFRPIGENLGELLDGARNPPEPSRTPASSSNLGDTSLGSLGST